MSSPFTKQQKELIQRARDFAEAFRIDDGDGFHLQDVDPGDRLYLGNGDKPRAMDAAGKDGTIKHVMSGVNPQGCQVTSFKAPSAVALDHDDLWRCSITAPERGRIDIFNRSHYKATVVVRVQKEQRENPEKNWKFSANDIHERAYWDDYMKAYEDTIRHTASKKAPGMWCRLTTNGARVVVAAAIIDTLDSLNLHCPEVSPQARQQLEKARQELLGEKGWE